MNMNTRRVGQTVGTAAGLVALALLGGCGSPASGPAAPGRHVYAGLDASASWRPWLGVSATLCARQALRLDPGRDRLTLYRVDRQAQEFFDDAAPESGDHLQATIIRQVRDIPSAGGTFPAVFWKAAADRVSDDRGPVTVELFSDGDNDDQTAAARADIAGSARRLAANPRVTAWVFGAARENWAALRAEFAPLGDRFHLCGPADMTAEKVAQAAGPGQ